MRAAVPAVSEIIQVHDRYYILASSSLADTQTRVLKQGETFAVFDASGDIQPVGLGEQGIYHEGTRHLSRLELRFGEDRPLLLSSTVQRNNIMLAVDLANPDIRADDQVLCPRDVVHVFRSSVLWHGVCHCQLRVRNFSLEPLSIPLHLLFSSDFADIFEVRGLERPKRGQLLEPLVEPASVTLRYRGLDGLMRRTRINVDPPPAEVSANSVRLDYTLEPKTEFTTFIQISCECEERPTPLIISYEEAREHAMRGLEKARTHDCVLYTSNEQLNDWINRSLADLHMLTSVTRHGFYPYAGVPWFSTPFGRDGIITALQMLWFNPSLARGVLAQLAALQATENSAERDSNPGKIMHEMRGGEMAALGEIPFGLYYGSIDSTPLFVILAGAYLERSGDIEFISSIWPHISGALLWLKNHGDMDGDGFVEYARQSPKGLVHQGWKDSQDSVFHTDGTLAQAPIALCEVQAYAHGAKRAGAQIATLLGHHEVAESLRAEAEQLRRQFAERFWLDDLGTYALALDGDKHPCRVKTSNAGQCLFTGIALPEHAAGVAHGMMSDVMFTGWGVRTLAASERRYNPMSYHNGSLWPHDNSLVALGLALCDFKEEAMRILTGLLDASLFMEDSRLPELFCGFTRRPEEGPTHYPVACSPQAWASGAVFLIMQAVLGLQINAHEETVTFNHSSMPSWLNAVHIRNLQVGDSTVDLDLHRHATSVAVNLVRRTGQTRIITIR